MKKRAKKNGLIYRFEQRVGKWVSENEQKKTKPKLINFIYIFIIAHSIYIIIMIEFLN